MECYTNAVAPTSLPVVKDVCGNTLIAPEPVESGTVTSNAECSGTVIYTYTYKDCADLAYVWTYTYTIKILTAPVVPADGSLTVSCPTEAVNPGSPGTILDDCGRTVTPTLVGSSASPDCNGTVTWTYRYTACDGTTTADWTYTYTIAQPPFGPITPTFATVNCYTDIVLPDLPAVIDACGNTITPTGPVEGSVPTCDGDVTYTWTYTNCAGAGTSETAVVKVIPDKLSGTVSYYSYDNTNLLLSNVTISLLDAHGDILATTITCDAGYYEFTDPDAIMHCNQIESSTALMHGGLSSGDAYDRSKIEISDVELNMPGAETFIEDGMVRIEWYDMETWHIAFGETFVTLTAQATAANNASDLLFTYGGNHRLEYGVYFIRYELHGEHQTYTSFVKLVYVR